MNFWAISTEIQIVVLMLITVVMDLLLAKDDGRERVAYVTVAGLVGILVYSLGLYHGGDSLYFLPGLYIADNYALFFKQLFILAVIFAALFSIDFVRKCVAYRGEYYTLLLSALLGMCVLASSNDFLTMFVGLELMTISFYILVGMRMDRKTAGEAAVKYLLVGAGSTAVMLYGISFVYGAGGSLSYITIDNNMHMLYAAGLAGVVMVMIGFFFKLSVIPFHMWAPDVYQGAPTPVTALLAMASKGAGIAAFMRILYVAFPVVGQYWLPMLAGFSAVCMVGGNVMALRQTDVKRMLAYSSIAQAGYMMAGMVAFDQAGMKAVMFYAMLYVFANVGAFSVLTAIDTARGGTTQHHLTGLCHAAPLLSVVMSVSLLSMAGIPPTAGFAGKLYIFTAAVDRGYLWLAVVGFVMSMISVYYYLLVAKAMFRDLDAADDPALEDAIRVPLTVRATAFVAVCATVGIGVCPEFLATITNLASQTFMH